ncbi:MAG: ABC transporter ATP-binding protein [bacterium]|jgi:sulfonate transport system ATP-binding protein
MAGVKVNKLYKIYHLNGREIPALQGINLEVEEGSFVTVVGKSGCGKTTLLRILAGLEEKSRGKITFLNSRGEKNEVSIVFQEPRLMPWLTVKQNMVFSLRKCSPEIIEEKANKYLRLLGLEGFQDAYPHQISGGMAQRVALGRTLCYGARLILMDEPLSALDAFTRRKLQQEILNIYHLEKLTVLFVTHDVEEAVFLGQKVVVMDQGRVMGEIPVELPCPRDTHSNHFFQLKEKVLDLILGRNNH